MIYVLDKEKDCIQKRTSNICDKDCRHCECHIESSTLLDSFERIINMVYNINKHSTRKDY